MVLKGFSCWLMKQHWRTVCGNANSGIREGFNLLMGLKRAFSNMFLFIILLPFCWLHLQLSSGQDNLSLNSSNLYKFLASRKHLKRFWHPKPRLVLKLNGCYLQT